MLVPSGMKTNGFKNAIKTHKLPPGRVSAGQMEKMDVQLLSPVPEGRSTISKLSPSLPLPNLFPLGCLFFLPPAPPPMDARNELKIIILGGRVLQGKVVGLPIIL